MSQGGADVEVSFFGCKVLVSKKGRFAIFTLLLHYHGLQFGPVTFKALENKVIQSGGISIAVSTMARNTTYQIRYFHPIIVHNGLQFGLVSFKELGITYLYG
jgi:hypothetical protein